MKIDGGFRITHGKGDYYNQPTLRLDQIHDGRFKASFGHNAIYWLVEAEEIVSAYIEITSAYEHDDESNYAFAATWEQE